MVGSRAESNLEVVVTVGKKKKKSRKDKKEVYFSVSVIRYGLF